MKQRRYRMAFDIWEKDMKEAFDLLRKDVTNVDIKELHDVKNGVPFINGAKAPRPLIPRLIHEEIINAMEIGTPYRYTDTRFMEVLERNKQKPSSISPILSELVRLQRLKRVGAGTYVRV